MTNNAQKLNNYFIEDIERMQLILAEKKEEIENLTKKNNDLNKNSKLLLNQINKKHREKEELNKEKEELKKENEKLKKEKEKLNKEKEELNKEKEELKKENEKLKKEKEKLNKEKEELKKNNEKLNKENKSFQTQKNNDIYLINNLYHKIENLEIELVKEKEKNNINTKKLLEKNELIEKLVENQESELDNCHKEIENNKKEIAYYTKEVKNYQKEIEDLKEKLAILPFEISKGDKIISVILNSVDQKINYSLICKNNHKSDYLLEDLCKKIPYYNNKKSLIYFIANGNNIDSSKTLDENHIKDNNIILINESRLSMADI